LLCDLFGDENGVGNDLTCTVNVISTLHLDRLNDTTICFIPAAEEGMDFVFRYNETLGLTEENDIFFKIFDNQDDLVYSHEIPFEEFNVEPPPYNIPGISYMMRAYPLIWSGRINEQSHPQNGQLAFPHNDPYQARVDIYEGENLIISTNTETFDIVPMIDSVLIGHDPFYPPIERPDITEVFSVIRGRVNDTGDPIRDNVYYSPVGGEWLPFWKNENSRDCYMFWDVDNEKFYENNYSLPIGPIVQWETEFFGDLDYRWFVIKDQRIGTTAHVSYENTVDTTAQWGNSWNIELTSPANWLQPRTSPYMRILTYSEMDNIKNGYYLQGGRSATGPDAHKLIFVDDWSGTTGLDLAEWGISHVGVPYTYGVKTPYISNDCGGFVTSCRIEQLGLNANPNLSIDRISSLTYYNGVFGGELFTENILLPQYHQGEFGPGYRGLMIFIYDRNFEYPWTNHRHIMIVFWLTLDNEYPYDAVPTMCRVVHAKGGYHSRHNGRVKIESAISAYPPYLDIEGYRDNDWVWNYIKFVD
jgi:hypothetical protein